MKDIWEKIPIKGIKLSGIHKNLLDHQGEGLTKHIGSVFKDLSDHSAWLGGDGESWERGPYYIDGLIPLAYLLDDQELIDQAKKWIEKIFESQDDSGFFGPKSNHDSWPRAVVMKAMVSYYLATEDFRVVTFLENYIKYLNQHIDEQPFEFWGYARGLEGKETLDLMRKISEIKDIDQLEQKLKDNTLDWASFFKQFPYEKPTHSYINKYFFHAVKPFFVFFDHIAKTRKNPKIKEKNKILKARQSKNNYTYLTTHGVNLAMALKYLVYNEEKEDIMFEALDKVLQSHGNALYLFSSDEHLNGLSPETGIELCTVVEMMYTMEETMRLTGSMKAADYLEYYAYNALLATISKDFCSHQYVQQVNQLDCEVKRHDFYDANRYANTFGVAPNFGCCAANMHQGWPKLMTGAVMKKGDDIYMFMYVSGTYQVKFDDGYMTLKVETSYPFEDYVKITCIKTIRKSQRDLVLRIPFKSKTIITRNDIIEEVIENQDTYVVEDFKLGNVLNLNFDFQIETIKNPDQSISVKKGPLLFAQEIKGEEFLIKGKKPFHDRGYHPLEKVSLVPVIKNEKVVVKSKDFEYSKNTFFDNKIWITIEGYDPKTNHKGDIKLIPYGLTTLRKTQFKY